MTNHKGDESTLILDFDIANSAQTEYCSTFHFPSVPPWPLGPLGPMDHVDNLDILHHLDHSDRSNHFDNPDWSMIDQEDNCRIRIVYLVLFSVYFTSFLDAAGGQISDLWLLLLSNSSLFSALMSHLPLLLLHSALFLLQVDYQGNVTLLTQGIYMTKCQIDVTHYPFDPQVSISNLPIRQLLDNLHNNTIVWHVLLS